MFRRLLAVALLACIALVPSTAGRADPQPLRILAVGDSITAQCSEPSGGWCAPLLDLLTARGIPATITVVAVPGATCGGLIAPLQAALAVGDYDLMVLNCGTNNPTSTPPQRGQLGWEWRTLVESAYVDGALIMPTLVQYSDPGISAWQGRGWLPESEARANDVLYGQWGYYDPFGWFPGKLDLQKIPATRSFLLGGTDGIHPNIRGRQTIAALTYRGLRAHYGWPDDVAEPCDLYGARPDPAYQTYVTFVPC
jgi:lysophospholipase L1-like esterase